MERKNYLKAKSLEYSINLAEDQLAILRKPIEYIDNEPGDYMTLWINHFSKDSQSIKILKEHVNTSVTRAIKEKLEQIVDLKKQFEEL